MPQDFARHLRVGSELHRIINLLLQDEIKDPRLKSVRVSDVDLSGDLGVARVFYSSLDPDCDPAPIDAALAKATPFIRGRLGRIIKLRRVPELRFEQDLSVREGFRISQLIREARDAAGTHVDDDPAHDDD
jgi:ribosome-binding factor A